MKSNVALVWLCRKTILEEFHSALNNLQKQLQVNHNQYNLFVSALGKPLELFWLTHIKKMLLSALLPPEGHFHLSSYHIFDNSCLSK